VLCTVGVRAFSREGHETTGERGSLGAEPAANAAVAPPLAGKTIADAAEWPDAFRPPSGAIFRTQLAEQQ